MQIKCKLLVHVKYKLNADLRIRDQENADQI